MLVKSHDWQCEKPFNEPQLRFQMHREKVEVRSALLEVFDERVGILQQHT